MGFAGSPVRNSAAALLQCLQSLPALAELGLAFTDFQLPAHIPHFASLRRLTVSFDVWPGARAVSLPALQQALPGITLVLQVHLQAVSHGKDCEEYSDPCSADRARVWAAIAKVPALEELHLSASISHGVHERAQPVEIGLLGRVCCKELVLHSDMLLTPFAAHLLCMVDCGTVLCRQRFEGTDSAPLQWSSLAPGSGIFVLELGESASLAISGCPGNLPDIDPPWALVLASASQDSISGLPQHLFQPGPEGCRVWRSSSVTDPTLDAAFTKLRMKRC